MHNLPKQFLFPLIFSSLLTGYAPHCQAIELDLSTAASTACYGFAAIAAFASVGSFAKMLGILPRDVIKYSTDPSTSVVSSTEIVDASSHMIEGAALAIIALLAYRTGHFFME